MERPSDYSIIIGESDHDLVRRVNDEMEKGWVPQGSVYRNKDGYPCQPVVKYDYTANYYRNNR